MAKAPCKDCDRRHLKCHSDCIDYALYRKELENEKKEKSKYSELNEVRKDTQTKFIKYNTQHRK